MPASKTFFGPSPSGASGVPEYPDRQGRTQQKHGPAGGRSHNGLRASGWLRSIGTQGSAVAVRAVRVVRSPGWGSLTGHSASALASCARSRCSGAMTTAVSDGHFPACSGMVAHPCVRLEKMDLGELIGLLATTRDHEVLFLREEVPELTGWLREVIVRRDWTVVVEVRQAGFDEGGIIFKAQPAGVDEALGLLERVLHAPIASWQRLLPGPEPMPDGFSGGHEVVEWIRGAGVGVPPIPPFKILSSYWRERVGSSS